MTKTFNGLKRTNKSFEEVFSGEYSVDLFAPPSTVLDVGANEGAFTAWALKQWPKCHVTAFEPMPANATLFRQNHSANAQVMFHELALAASEKLEMHPGRTNSGTASAFDIGEQRQDSILVNCTDPATLESAEFVKVDTEGCEVEIISRLNLYSTKALVCEYHRQSDVDRIIDIVAQAGLEIISHKERVENRGVLKFARPGVLAGERNGSSGATAVIPDNMRLAGNTKDGRLLTLTAGDIRNEHYRPELAGKKLFIGLPIYTQMPVFFMQCLLALQARKPLPLEIQISQGDGVARSRNSLTAEFLRSDCTHLLLIDSDLIFTSEHIARILSHNLPVVGGFYPKKQEGKLEWVINTLLGHPPLRPDHLQPVKYVGTGFICIAREVFEKMASHYPGISYREDYGQRLIAHDYWPMGVYRDPKNPKDEGRYLSEDWYFCQRWLDMGGEIFADARVILRHCGPAVYPLRTQVAQINDPDNQTSPSLNMTDRSVA